MKLFGDVRDKVALVSFVFLFAFYSFVVGVVDWVNPVQSYIYLSGTFFGEYEELSDKAGNRSIRYEIELENGRNAQVTRPDKEERLSIGYKVCFRVGLRKSNVYRPVEQVALSECRE